MVGNFEIQINVARGAVPPIETVTDIGIGALADVEGSLTIRAGEFVYDSALPPLPHCGFYCSQNTQQRKEAFKIPQKAWGGT